LRNCRGDDDIDAKRSRPSIGKTREMCHARKERVVLVGTQSADYIRASGHSGRIPRPYTWLHPTRSLKCPIFLLHRGRRPYMAHRDISRQRSNSVAFGAKRTSTEFTSTRPRHNQARVRSLKARFLTIRHSLAARTNRAVYRIRRRRRPSTCGRN